MARLKIFEYKFKAFFFGLLKGTLKKRTPKTEPLDVSQIKRVIFFRQDRLGDMVVTLPIIDGLKKSFPHIDVSILASPNNLPLIKDDPRFEKIFLYTKNLNKDFKTIREIKKENYDCIIDTLFNDSVTGLFLSQYCSNGRPIIGIGKDKYREYYDFCFESKGDHLVDTMLKILNAFGIDSKKISGHGGIYLTDDKVTSAGAFFETISTCSDYDNKIGINLSAGAPNRIWQEEQWVELVEQILTHHPQYKIILITAPEDRQKAFRIKKHFDKNVYVIPDKLDILDVSAIIKRLNLLVTADTSLVHIARGYQLPVVGLYSNHVKNFELWHPYNQKSGAVRAKDHDDVFDITPEQVMNKIVELIGIHQEVKQ